ncbi:hypothetical protein K470DRAFT_20326 [Piedraia hortae CBS 480.64]|uniref:Uncharacterized protein n=1 Tax=Piedraia hortae CBS 480.64 TaxID=1314780 RepID=A0A6A7C418_9PEZI|nr:hypothetical protein K470DRAFT_20326 [Piedraia hortae CBS 480.64]
MRTRTRSQGYLPPGCPSSPKRISKKHLFTKFLTKFRSGAKTRRSSSHRDGNVPQPTTYPDEEDDKPMKGMQCRCILHTQQQPLQDELPPVPLKDEQLPERETLVLRTREVNRLLTALANAPLLQRNVSRASWEGSSDSLREQSPRQKYAEPLTTEKFADFSSTRRRPRQQPRRKPKSEQKHEEGKTQPPQEKSFIGAALISPLISGAPVLFTSQDYTLGKNTIAVGECTFLNVPYAASGAGVLRVEPPSPSPSLSPLSKEGGILSPRRDSTSPKEGVSARIAFTSTQRASQDFLPPPKASPASQNRISGSVKITYQLLTPLLSTRGKRVYLLAVEVDVTDYFLRAVLDELRLRDYIPVLEDSKEEVGDVDWSSAATSARKISLVTDTVENVAGDFRHLTVGDTAGETITLLKELGTLRDHYRDVVVVVARGWHDNGIPRGLAAPWVSTSLALYEDLGKLKRKVITSVASHLATGGSSPTKIRLNYATKKILIIPLIQGESKAGVWTCFLTDTPPSTNFES